MNKDYIEISEQFRNAYEAMERKSGIVFITGKAGTGKSTLLRYFRERTGRAVAVIAPTGVAAVNVDGQTIHSFFKLRPGCSLDEAREEGVTARRNQLYKKIETIIIDEVSMVRADLMDCIDVFLRAALKSKTVFGGKKMVFIGDLWQLPPIVSDSESRDAVAKYQTPFFFSSLAVSEAIAVGGFEYLELSKVYRQNDADFISLLNSVREGNISNEALEILNSRYDPFFADPEGEYTHLMALNAPADRHNEDNLARLPGSAAVCEGKLTGDFYEKDTPTDLMLKIKPGARVMMVNNDAQGRWVNGTLATVKTINKESVVVVLDDGREYEILPFTWNKSKVKFDKESKELFRENVGSFTQFPLRLAWATTIHKSQGKTFDRIAVDLGRGAFAAGQVYVALSRSRTLGGIVLKRPVRRSDLIVDTSIANFAKQIAESGKWRLV